MYLREGESRYEMMAITEEAPRPGGVILVFPNEPYIAVGVFGSACTRAKAIQETRRTAAAAVVPLAFVLLSMDGKKAPHIPTA